MAEEQPTRVLERRGLKVEPTWLELGLELPPNPRRQLRPPLRVHPALAFDHPRDPLPLRLAVQKNAEPEVVAEPPQAEERHEHVTRCLDGQTSEEQDLGRQRGQDDHIDLGFRLARVE